MPEIAFHTGLPDKLGYTCRLLRKAGRQGARVRVIGDAAELELLDKALWTFDPQDFVAHLRWPGGARVSPMLQRTLIWLTPDAAAWPEGVEPPRVLVNLGPEAASGVEAYDRVVEIVSTDGADRAAAHRRWRHYESQGLTLRNIPAAAGR
ncbi:MAG TPA: DNA polymerase III subunit chi [Rubrivivax sp.]